MTDAETDAEFLKRMCESTEYGTRDCAYGVDFLRLLSLARRGAAIPDEPDDGMIAAGIDMRDQIDKDLENYVAGETPDWDTAMICAAIYRAMIQSALKESRS